MIKINNETALDTILRLCLRLGRTYLPFKPTFMAVTLADVIIHLFAGHRLDTFKKISRVEPFVSVLHMVNVARSFTHLPIANKPITWLTISMCNGVAIAIPYLLNRWWYRLEPLPEVPEELLNVRFSWEKPESDIAGQISHIFQLGISLAMIALAKERIFFTATFVLNLYVLYKQTQRKWLTITVDHKAEMQHPKTKEMIEVPLQLRYHVILMPKTEDLEKDNCAICFDSLNSDYSICSHHSLHQTCLARMIAHRVANINPKTVVEKSIRTREGWNDFLFVGTPATYQCSLLSESLPSCPNCTKTLDQNKLSIQMLDPIVERLGWVSRFFLYLTGGKSEGRWSDVVVTWM